MKRTYYTIAAIGLLALIGYFRFGRSDSAVEPSLPVPSDSAREEQPAPVRLPELPTIPVATLPAIPPPVDGPLVIPAPASAIPLPLAGDSATSPAASVADISAIPVASASDAPTKLIPPLTQVSTPAQAPTVPVVPQPFPSEKPLETPVLPTPPSLNVLDASGPAPNVPVAPAAPIPVIPAIPVANEAPAAAAVAIKVDAKYAVLRGKTLETSAENKLLVELMGCKLIAIEGFSSVGADNVKARQGTIERLIARQDIVFTGDSRDEVYRFMRNRVPANDPVLRLVVARWCMFNGLREQALAEAKEILLFQPENKAAADLARSLVDSLKQFPADGSVAASQTALTKSATVSENELEITPEAATTFATRIQPILANLCVDCHARADHDGAFKLARGAGYEVGPQVTQVNLRATASQISKVEPLNSPLLTKSIAAHGGMNKPPFSSRQLAGYRALESWVVLAVGNLAANSSGATPTSFPAGQSLEVPAVVGSTPQAQSGAPASPGGGLPPVEANPKPVAGAAVPVVPPVVSVPAVLPTPPTMSPAVPSQPPVIPVPNIPPSAPGQGIELPKVPIVPPGVQPASGNSSNSQFGVSAHPRPAPMPTTVGDEFDASNFNRGGMGK